MSDLLDQIMGSMSTSQGSSNARTSSTGSMGRIPKRDNRNQVLGGPASKKRPEEGNSFQSSSSKAPPGRDSFVPADKLQIQLNMFALKLAKMPARLRRCRFEVNLNLPGGRVFCLNDGLVAVSGDVNTQIRRLAQYLLFRKFFDRHRQLFAGKDHSVVAYDCAATFYVPEMCYTGGDDQVHEDTLTEADFEAAEWEHVAKLMRKRGSFFTITVAPTGFVYTRGEQLVDLGNRMELTRCIEIVTSQNLNNAECMQFGKTTFPMVDTADFRPQTPDELTEIRSGFAKVARLVRGRQNNNEVIMTIDTKQAPFQKSTSLIKFMSSKLNESLHGGGGGGGRGGGRGGHGRSDSRDFRGGRRGDYRDYSRGRDYRDDRGRGDYRDDRNRDYRDERGGRGGGAGGSDYSSAEADELTKFFNERDTRSVRSSIVQALKGLCLEATHLSNGSNKMFVCSGLSEGNAENTEFDLKDEKGERRISVAEYYLQTYNLRLKHPRLPLISSKRMRSVSFFPAELLRILPGQRIKVAQMSAKVQSSMTGSNCPLPQHHVNLVQTILRDFLRLENNPYMEAFGIELESREPLKLPAHILSPAWIKFSNQTYKPNVGNVQFKAKARFVQPANIEKVAVVVFDRAVRESEANDFCEALYRFCEENGIRPRTSGRQWIVEEMNSSDNATLKRKMAEWQKDGVTILIGIAREKKPEVHDVMKYYEEMVGMQTMQLCSATVNKMLSSNGRQTIENVMRKLNLKCGGTNFELQIPREANGRTVCSNEGDLTKKLFEQTQFIGFEISHGASRTLYDRSRGQMDGDPSVVGVAYSLANSTSLGGFTYLQTGREYKLQHLAEKFVECVKAYDEKSTKLPSKIVIYRVGMGEGDYSRIREEIADIKSSFDTIRQGYRPKLVVIVAQKNSHTRIFPAVIRGGGARDQNVQSGTCIEHVVTSVDADEFILVSQSPLIGTVRPTRYTVLENEMQWSKNEIMHLTYFLAFGHQVSYQPPSVPDILYAAENLAKRGKNNWNVHRKFENMQDIERRVIEANAELVNEDMREQLADAIVTSISKSMNRMTISRRNFWA